MATAGQSHPQGVVVSALGVDAPMHVWDAANGALVFSFKSNACLPRTLRSMDFTTLQGQTPCSFFLLASQASRPAVKLWTWGKEQVLYTCGTSERIVSTATSSTGGLVVGGSASGKCFLWEVASGKLLSVWQAHYKPVSSIIFTDGDSFVLSGGEDANIHSWNLVDVLAHERAGKSGSPSPTKTLTGHSLPVTSLAAVPNPASSSLGQHSLVLSTAADRTVRLWNINLGACIATRTVDSAATCCVVDNSGTRVFVGCADGQILDIPLLHLGSSHHATLAHAVAKGALAAADASWAGHVLGGHASSAEGAGIEEGGASASGGAQGGDAAASDDEGDVALTSSTGTKLADSTDTQAHLYTLEGHAGAVHSLALHGAGHSLFSASADGTVRFWEVSSRQCVRVLTPNKTSGITGQNDSGTAGGADTVPVTSVLWLPQPPGVPTGVPPKNLPAIAPLSKFKTPATDASADAVQPVFMAAAGTDFDQLAAALARGADVASDTLSLAGGAAPVQVAAGADSAEVARLQAEVARWQAVNNALLQRLNGGAVAEEAEAEPAAKAPRTRRSSRA